ncbi:hypothetical protein [Mycobacterium tuberculosis]|uniref:hypothetical protein n=1 Tax=Mycobacterium tuberculosis TaxID=1773 RepID=UPI000920C1C5|nr:hypothetical protein [Mycobacterium tuberculosis]SGG70193.1 sigma-70 family RNA polymerase sigma factor [Mycobacterium tuberculosis]
MVTVEADVDQVERRLAAGELSCPSCGGVLAGWGRARSRQLRGPAGPVELCPRRSRCTGCGVTHVLLPVRGWLRRFAERVEAVRSVFTVWLCAVDADPVMPDAGGGGFVDAVVAIGALAAAIGRRFSLPTVSLAETAVAVSGGRLLAPGWPGEWVQHESTLP